MKKAVKLLCGSILVIVFLASCKNNSHEHTFSDKWVYDSQEHWQEATCEHTDEKGNKGKHSLEDLKFNDFNATVPVCGICGYNEHFPYLINKESFKSSLKKVTNYTKKEKYLSEDAFEALYELDDKVYHSYVNLNMSGSVVEDYYYVKDGSNYKQYYNSNVFYLEQANLNTNVDENKFLPLDQLNELVDRFSNLNYDKVTKSYQANSISLDGYTLKNVSLAFEQGAITAASYSYESSVSKYEANFVFNQTAISLPWENDLNFYFNQTSEGIVITGLKENVTSLTIPAEVELVGKKVKIIKIQSLNIPTIKDVSQSTYEIKPCTNLKTITLSEGLIEIGDGAFKGCSSLSSITIPNSVTTLGQGVFIDCNSLAEIILGTGLKEIGLATFSNCKKLSKITIPEGVASIGERAFANCSNLLNIIIPNTVGHIGKGAFANCSKLEDITLPFTGNGTDVHHVGYIFGADSAEQQKDFVPASLHKIVLTGGSSIKASAFVGCENITNVVLPDGIEKIEENAFKDCKQLQNPVFPTSLTNIEAFAFSGCSFTKFEIPTHIFSLELGAFSNCSSLASISLPFTGDGKTISHIGYIFSNDASKITLPENLKEVTLTTGSVIKKESFKNCNQLISITLPAGITTIEDYAFMGCSQLKTILLPDTLKEIGSSAFSGCSAQLDWGTNPSISIIKASAFENYAGINLIIPDSVNQIERAALLYANRLEQIILPFVGASSTAKDLNYFSYIFGSSENDAYHNASYVPNSLTKVTIKTGTKIGVNAFVGCKHINEIVLPNTIEMIENGAFRGCESLTTLVLPEGITSVGNNAFMECSSLVELVLPDTILTIGSENGGFASVFYGCSSLEKITLPNQLRSINSRLFYGCTNLTSIVIPSTLERISSDAFDGCAIHTVYFNGSLLEWLNSTITGNLLYQFERDNHFYIKKSEIEWEEVKELVIPGGVTSIESYKFYGFNHITSLTLPQTVLTIGMYAFAGCKFNHALNLRFITTIEQRAFSGCDELTSIILGSNLVSIGSSALPYLSTIYYMGTADTWNTISISSENSNIIEAKRYYYNENPDETEAGDFWCFEGDGETPKILHTHTFETQWSMDENSHWLAATCEHTTIKKDFGNHTEGRLCSICGYLKSTPGLTYELNTAGTGYIVSGIGTATDTDLVFPEIYNDLPVVEIKADAFKYNNSITSVVIPKTITAINTGAFTNCYLLAEVYNLSALAITNTGYQASYHGNVGTYAKIIHTSMDEESNLVKIDDFLFVKDVKNQYYLLKYCGENTDIVLPDGINGSTYIINENSFYKSNLTSVTISDKVTEIQQNAFSWSSNLISVIIGDGVTTIGEYAFNRCTKLTSIVIGFAVKTIGQLAFYHNDVLAKVYYKGTQWPSITIGSDNDNLKNAARYTYAETEPTTTGKYWHYVDGLVTEW